MRALAAATRSRWLLVAFLAHLAACSTGDPAGPVDPPEPVGQERLFLHRLAPLELAPGREAWVRVSARIETSPSTTEPVPAAVTFTSSDPAVAAVVAGDSGIARVVARSVGTATLTVRSTRDPANVLTLGVTVREAPRGNEEGLVYSAAAALVPTLTGQIYPDAPLGPMTLGVTLTVANPTAGSRDVWLAGCTAWTRLYPGAEPSGEPVVDVPRDVECMASPVHVSLAPGESRSFPAPAHPVDAERDTMPPGRYHVAVVVDRLRDILEVPAGPVDVPAPNAGLAFEATTAVSGAPSDTLHAHVTVRNTNAEPARLEYGDCALALLAYRDASRTGTPVWSSAALRAPGGQPYACANYLAYGKLQPGETASPRELNRAFPVNAVLGDSLPSARYYFRARVRMNWRVVEVDAGEAELRR